MVKLNEMLKMVVDIIFKFWGQDSYEGYKTKCKLLKQLEYNYKLVIGDREDPVSLVDYGPNMIIVQKDEWIKPSINYTQFCSCLNATQIHRLAEWNSFINSIISEYDKRGIDKCVNTTILRGDIYWDKVYKECDNINILISELKSSVSIVNSYIALLIFGGVILVLTWLYIF